MFDGATDAGDSGDTSGRTKHLLLLEAVGLVTSDREGRERIWRIQPEPLVRAGDYLTALSRRWDSAIDRLRAYVED